MSSRSQTTQGDRPSAVFSRARGDVPLLVREHSVTYPSYSRERHGLEQAVRERHNDLIVLDSRTLSPHPPPPFQLLPPPATCRSRDIVYSTLSPASGRARPRLRRTTRADEVTLKIKPDRIYRKITQRFALGRRSADPCAVSER